MTDLQQQVLTKHQILSGVAATETVHIDRLNGEVVIRPLTDGEATQCQTMALKGLSVNANMPQQGAKGPKAAAEAIDALKMDLAALSDGHAEATRFAVAKALSIAGGDTWTPAEVARMPSGAPEEIYAHVVRLTGTDPIADSQTSTGEEALGDAARFREDG